MRVLAEDEEVGFIKDALALDWGMLLLMPELSRDLVEDSVPMSEDRWRESIEPISEFRPVRETVEGVR